MDSDPIIRDLEIMADARNYQAWIIDHIKSGLGRKIVEVGAGIGTFTSRLLDRDVVIALDTYEPCVEYLKKRYHSYPQILPIQADISSPEVLSLKKYEPDTIICLNVLEHVQDDEVALAHMYQLLPEGGHLALLVPAYQFLYGTIDRLVGHHRRYTKKDLEGKLGRASFSIKKIQYMNSLATTGWFMTNRVFKQKEESPAQVKLYDRYVVPWLRVVERIVPVPFGLSLVVVATKKTK